MPGRYVLIPEGSISIELTPSEWAVVLDSLEKAHSNRENGYSPVSRAALYRSMRKFQEAAEQLRGIQNGERD